MTNGGEDDECECDRECDADEDGIDASAVNGAEVSTVHREEVINAAAREEMKK